MFVLLSPAKKLQEAPTGTNVPHFIKEAEQIANEIRPLSKQKLQVLLGTSQAITTLNQERFENYSSKNLIEYGTMALHTYAGDVYKFFNPSQFDQSHINYINTHFGIISGLYGILKPHDKMLPYRLEMKNKLYVNNLILTQFWRKRLTKYLQDILAPNTPIIMLCSNEYANAISNEGLNLIQVSFKELRDGTLKTIALNAKRARGMMAAYITQRKIQDHLELKNFNEANYQFSRKLSSDNHFVFIK